VLKEKGQIQVLGDNENHPNPSLSYERRLQSIGFGGGPVKSCRTNVLHVGGGSMRGLWIGLLIILLAVGVGLIIWLPWPWNLAVGILVLIKLSAAFALFRALGRMGQRRSS
jgi:hypothetical protein